MYSVTERFVNQQKKKGYEKNPENVLSLLELLHHKSNIGSRKMFQKWQILTIFFSWSRQC